MATKYYTYRTYYADFEGLAPYLNQMEIDAWELVNILSVKQWQDGPGFVVISRKKL